MKLNTHATKYMDTLTSNFALTINPKCHIKMKPNKFITKCMATFIYNFAYTISAKLHIMPL